MRRVKNAIAAALDGHDELVDKTLDLVKSQNDY
jgi:hypothetical protein